MSKPHFDEHAMRAIASIARRQPQTYIIQLIATAIRETQLDNKKWVTGNTLHRINDRQEDATREVRRRLAGIPE